MVDTGYENRAPATGERQRLRRLAQAALNADMTVDQVNTILDAVGGTLGDMDRTIGGLDGTIDSLDATLSRFGDTLDDVDATVAKLSDVVDRLERVTGRLEIIVGVAEFAVRPIVVLESLGRSVATGLGRLR